MLCRVAENLFWVSRYTERAMAMVRLVDVTTHLELDAGDSVGTDFWTPLLGPLENLAEEERLEPAAIRRHLALDPGNPNSILTCILRARAAAREIRDSISSEMWEQLNTMHLSLNQPELLRAAELDPDEFYSQVRNGVQLFQGFAHSTMPHDEGWHFFNLGRFFERADNVARVLRLQAHLLLRGAVDGAAMSGDEMVHWLAVLRSAGCAEAYARYYSLRVEPARVVEFLLLNPVFPQSVRYCLSAAAESLAEIARPIDPGLTGSVAAVRTLGRLRAQLEHSAVDEILQAGLEPYLEGVQRRLATATEDITQGFFWAQPEPIRPGAVARAAMIMSISQQQQ